MKPVATSNDGNAKIKIMELKVCPLKVRSVRWTTGPASGELSVLGGLVLTPQLLKKQLPHVASVVQSTIHTTVDIPKIRDVQHQHQPGARTKKCSKPQQESQSLNPFPCQLIDKQNPGISHVHQLSAQERSEVHGRSWSINPCPSQQSDKHPAKTYAHLPRKAKTLNRLPSQKAPETSDVHQHAERSSQPHRQRILNQFPCHICKERFPCRQSLNIHHLKHVERYKCQDCDRSFKNKEKLINHQCLICEHCRKGFKSRIALKKHAECFITELNPVGWKRPSWVEIFPCKLCSAVFRSRKLLLVHNKTHSKESLVCEVCNEYFENDFDLTTHMRFHNTPVRSYSALPKKRREINTNTVTVKREAECMSETSIRHADQQDTLEFASTDLQFESALKIESEVDRPPQKNSAFMDTSTMKEEVNCASETVGHYPHEQIKSEVMSDPKVPEPADENALSSRCTDSTHEPPNADTLFEACVVKKELLDIPSDSHVQFKNHRT